MRRIFPILLLFISIISACSRPDTYPPAEVVNLYGPLAEFARADSSRRAEIMANDSAVLGAFFKVIDGSEPSDSLAWMWSTSLPVAIFTPAVDSVYADTDTLAADLGAILGRAREAGLDLPRRKYGAVVWGKMESIVFVDSVMLIALNHYLGQEYAGYDAFPVYRRFTKAPGFLPCDMAEALVATRYPYEEAPGQTALQRMLYEGALAYAKKQLADAPDMYALGYRSEQLQFLLDNEGDLWRQMAIRGLLYDTSPVTIGRLIDPAPNTAVLDPRAPGRAGRFFGLRIVEAYARRHPDATLPFLLSPGFYRNPAILEEAQYSPASNS